MTMRVGRLIVMGDFIYEMDGWMDGWGIFRSVQVGGRWDDLLYVQKSTVRGCVRLARE